MYLRLVRAKAVPSAVDSLLRAYRESIIPALAKVPGCLHATLMQSSQYPGDFVSLTLWETVADAEAYVESGAFTHLMGLVRPFLQDTTEWRMGLSHDVNTEHPRPPRDHTVSAYPVSLDLPTKQRLGFKGDNLYLRILSVLLRPERKDEYHSLYLNRIIPALQTATGCLHAWLIMPSRGRRESLSVTIWDSRENAMAYEQSGMFAELLGAVKHTFTDLVQWKVELDHGQRRSDAQAQDVTVEGFNVVALKSFE